MNKSFKNITLMFITLLLFLTKVNAADNDLIDIKVNGELDYTKAQEVLELVNKERKDQGLNELKMDSELMESAMIRAMEIGVNFSHTRPNGSSCFTISNKAFGENIAAGNSTATATMNQWMNSSGHRANILGSDYNSIGIGVFKNGAIYYWVQLFGLNSLNESASKTGVVSTERAISIIRSDVILYAYSTTNSSYYGYLQPYETGYFNYGVKNQGWQNVYSPGVASDYKFSTSDSNVISINNDGNFTAVNEGVATVSLCLRNDSTKCYSEEITVKINPNSKNGVYYNYYTGNYELYRYNRINTSFTGIELYENTWYYFRNGITDFTYTGLAYNEKGTWFVKNGIVDLKYNGIFIDTTGTIYTMKNGKLDTAFTGLKYVEGKWYYFKSGKTDFKYNGMASNSNGTYYVSNGKITFKYNGTYMDNNGEIYFIKNSRIDTNVNGLKYVYNDWYYFKNGKIDHKYNGFATNSNGTYYVNNGKITFKYNGLVYYNKKWTAVVYSKINNSYTGILSNSNGTYLVENGTISFKYNGTYKDKNGNIYMINNSKVNTNVSGLKYVNKTWYYFKKGKTDLKYNGFATNSNGTYYVNNGKITFKYNGLVYYNKKWVAVINSKINNSYTGLLTNKNGTYLVVDGTVDFDYSGNLKVLENNVYKTYTIKYGKVIA